MDNKIKKKVIRRLKIIEGQIRGLQKMISEDKYCIDTIMQTSAVKKALSGVEDIILESHLSTCMIHQIKNKKETKVVKEILDVYKLSKNK
jgi:DNA-binding FrmR family transcriptional regulator